jgi:hypothetical protein
MSNESQEGGLSKTSTDMLISPLANTEKLVEPAHQYNYRDHRDEHDDEDEKIESCIDEKPEIQQQEDVKDIETMKNNDYTNNNINNQPSPTYPVNTELDEYDNATPMRKKILKMDMLRKLSELANNGVKVDSEGEKFIYNYLLDYYIEENIIYTGKNHRYKMHSDKYNENYIPDFLIKYNDAIYIIEFFGLYKPFEKKQFVQDYILKTHKKIDFYYDYCNKNNNYKFIDLYPKDIKNNLEGVKEKLSFLLN